MDFLSEALKGRDFLLGRQSGKGCTRGWVSRETYCRSESFLLTSPHRWNHLLELDPGPQKKGARA